MRANPVESTPRLQEDSLERLAAGVLMAGFPSTSVTSETRELIARGVRNFILFGRNVGPPGQIKALTRQLRDVAGSDALIAIDHEGGRVNRLRRAATQWPSPMAWAATGDLALTREASRVAARELASLGINLNFAPVADILEDHRNPVLGTRCFSDDPEMVAAFTAAFVEGHRDALVGATAKHFPGHGGTPTDSHIDLPRIGHTVSHLRQNDLAPFNAAIDAGVDCLMVSHVWYTQLDGEPTPATVSPSVIRLAREELDYDGVVVTDCLEMGAIQTRMSTGQAVVRAAVAGCDLLIVSHRLDRQQEAIEALVKAMRDGVVPVERLEEANRRISALRTRLCLHPTEQPNNGESMAHEIARRSVTLVRDDQDILPLHLVPDLQLGVVSFVPRAATEVEGSAESPPLIKQVRKRHAQVIEVTAEETGDSVDAIVQQLRGAETVLIGTSFAVGRPRQAEVVNALLQARKRVVVLGLRDPFDLLAFPDAPCYLASYSDVDASIEAALAVVFGEEEPGGHLPVALPGLYARGHGLIRVRAG